MIQDNVVITGTTSWDINRWGGNTSWGYWHPPFTEQPCLQRVNRHVSQSTHRNSPSFALLMKGLRNVPKWSCAGNSKGWRYWKQSRHRCHRSGRHPKSWGDLSRDVPSHFGPCTDDSSSLCIRGECSWVQSCLICSRPHNCRQMQSWRDWQSTRELRYSSPQGVFVPGAPRPNVHLRFHLSSCVCSEAE